MKRIIVAVALIATGSNVVAGPLCMSFHRSNKKVATPVADKKSATPVVDPNATLKAAIDARIGASQVDASEKKQEVTKPGFLSRLYRGARRHTKKIAFSTAALLGALVLDSKTCGQSIVGKMPTCTHDVVKNNLGQGYVATSIENGTKAVWAMRPFQKKGEDQKEVVVEEKDQKEIEKDGEK